MDANGEMEADVNSRVDCKSIIDVSKIMLTLSMSTMR